MLTTALLLMLAADIQPAFLADGAPRSVRLIQDSPPPADATVPNYSGWSRSQLKQEYARIKSIRPGIGGPIALMASGGGAVLVSLYVALITLTSGGGGPGILPVMVIFAVVGIAGAALLVIGGIVLSRILPDRKVLGRQMDEVERLAKERGGDDRQPDEEEQRYYVPPEPEIIGPPPEGPPPLPLPPMPSADQRPMVQFPLIFARF